VRKQRIITTLICATLLFGQAQFSAQAADGDNPAPSAPKATKNVDVELEKSRALIASKKYKEALTELKKVNKSIPNNADVNNLLGFASRKLGQ
jgi:Flp pilus assembly protein TadD